MTPSPCPYCQRLKPRHYAQKFCCQQAYRAAQTAAWVGHRSQIHDLAASKIEARYQAALARIAWERRHSDDPSRHVDGWARRPWEVR